MIGTLNSKVMDDDGVMNACINDKSYKILSYVLPFLEKIEMGTQVDATLTKEDPPRISKIKPFRQERDPGTQAAMSKAGFSQEMQTKEQIAKEHEEYNARARGTPTDKPGESVIGGEIKAPEGGIEGIVAATKARQEEKKDCTSSMTPADAGLKPDVRSSPKTLKGTVSSVNTVKNILVIEDTDGITHGFAYTAELDILVNKQKPRWFVEVTYRTQGDRELLTDIKYAERPASQKRGYGGSGARSYQPRNEKLIVIQSCIKACADVFAITTTPESMDFDAAMDLIITRAIHDTETIMKAGGA